MTEFALVKVVSGEYHEHLKGITLGGRIWDDRFIVHGCVDDQQNEFYEAVLKIDNLERVHGFETVEEVKEYWEWHGDMLFSLDMNDVEVVEV